MSKSHLAPRTTHGAPLLLPGTFFLLVAVFNIDRAAAVLGSRLPGQVTLRGWVGALAEDLVVAGLACGLVVLLFLALRRSRGPAVALCGAVLFALSVLAAANSLYVQYFHHVVTRPDLGFIGDPSLIRGSAAGISGGAFAAMALAPMIAFMALATAVGRRSASVGGAIVVIALIAGGLVVRVGVGQRSVRAGLSNPLWNAAAVLARPAVADPQDLAPLRALIAEKQTSFLSAVAPLWHSSPSRPPTPFAQWLRASAARPNVVFLFLEGMRLRETGVGGGRFANLTPHLDRLAREGIYFPQVYATGTHTYQAELASLFSAYPYPGAGDIIPDRVPVRLRGLPEILRDAGWRSQIWIHGNDRTEFHRDAFYPRHGVEIFDGRLFPRESPRTTWGYTDRVVLGTAVELLSQRPEPFLGLIITLSNHYPFRVPADAVAPYPRPALAPSRSPFDPSHRIAWGFYANFIQTIHYADEALGMFFEKARTKPWFSRTLFVVFGDHGLPLRTDRPYESEDDFFEVRDRVPLILYCPAFPAGTHVERLGAQVDIAPTVLSLLRIRSPSAFVGKDLLGGSSSDEPTVLNWGDGYTLRLIRPRWEYRGSVSEDLADIFEERLFDRSADERRIHDLSDAHPEIVREFRELARRYLRYWPAIIRKDAVVPREVAAQ